MKASDLAQLQMWDDWQRTVEAALPMYAKCPIYLEQNSVKIEDAERVAESIFRNFPIDLRGRTRDIKHGARALGTTWGEVTRAWLDSNVEWDFVRRHLKNTTSGIYDVLDVGAGYGRLAVSVQDFVNSYTCVDAVPVSTRVCRDYVSQYSRHGNIVIPTLAEWCTAPGKRYDLAVNIHSWNECSYEQIDRWLNALTELWVPWLFTVSHEHWLPDKKTAYHPHGDTVRSYRDLILRDYDLVAEESIGLGLHPHALWRRK